MQTTTSDVYGIRKALMTDRRQPIPAPRRWTAEEIADRLATDDAWLIRGLLALYARQTGDEQAAGHTRNLNGRGFNSADSAILSSYAEQVRAWQRGQSRWPLPLSVRQLAVTRRKLAKYAGQLAAVANGA